MIELRDVCGTWEPNRRFPLALLDGVDLRIERGEWVWLVGPQGAGKSSILRLLWAYSRASKGQVVFADRDLATLKSREIARLRQNIGVVPRDLALLPERSCLQNIAFALRVTGVSTQGVERLVVPALERVGLEARAQIRARDLTSIERVQLALARALAPDPALVLVDDALHDLEADDALTVGRVLHEFHAERGATVVMSTHSRALVDAFRHRVVRMRAGRVWSDENPGTFGSDDIFASAKRAWVAERVKTSVRG